MVGYWDFLSPPAMLVSKANPSTSLFLVIAAYMVLCDESLSREIAFAFLDRVKNDFQAKFGAKAAAVPPLGLNKEFG